MRTVIHSCGRASVLLACFMLVGCSDKCTETEEPAFRIHEWGVLVTQSGNTSGFLTSRPEEQSPVVEVPVIYVHCDDTAAIGAFTARVTFSSGGPTLTFPDAEVTDNVATWEQVAFAEDVLPQTTCTRAGHVPLEQIIGDLNDVDANVLRYRDEAARFLFYEGDIDFTNPIAVSYSQEAEEATFTNQGSYPIFNVILAVGDLGGGSFVAEVRRAHVDRLDPGAPTTVPFRVDVPVDLRLDLESQGLTAREAQVFARLWEPSCFYPTNSAPWANLIYRIPQAQYDSMIALDVTPDPTEIARVLYILVHIL